MTTMDRLRTLARDRGLTVDQSISKDAANYRRATGDSMCGNCAHFRAPDSCSIVAGVISRDMVSDYYAPRAGDARTRDPLTSKGSKIMAAMKEKYGEKRGKSVFYASRNKGTISGVDAVRHDPHTGQFTGAHQHEAAAEHHEEMAGYHEMHSHEARARGNNQASTAHHQAMRAHEQAIRAHKAGARSFAAPGYLQRVAPHASEASRHAAEVSRRTGARHHDKATQWDRIRRRARDRGLRVEDSGTSEGARKAAATRKAHLD